MEVTAKLRNVRMGTRRGRQVADLVRGKDCDEGLAILQGSPKRAARSIEKLVRSAIANAQSLNEQKSAGIDLDNLFIKTIMVDQSTHNWRIRPRAMGRATWIRKASSHVTVVLDER